MVLQEGGKSCIVVTQAYNPNIWEAKAREVFWVQGEHELHGNL